MRIDVFGGWSVEHDGLPVAITGDRQRGLLFRLALDPGTVVGYRALAEDLWPEDPPENPRASLQSLVARLRPQLPGGVLASAPGGYRLEVRREDVDVVRFQDLVAAASTAPAAEAARLAAEALALWTGEPWTPGAGYDWLERDLRADREQALRLTSGGTVVVPTASAPAPVTALVGRLGELEAIGGALARSRLVTVVGTGGAGKTRLAVEIARRTPGAVVVELAPVGAADLWTALLGELGHELWTISTNENAGPPVAPRDRAVEALAGRDVLLVLDNCEHVVDAVAPLAHDLLQALPRLSVLATSREPLGVPGEAVVPLGPLAEVDAERLFAERVLAARGTPLREDEAEAAQRIRARLDGLPLALELAAARTRTMTLDELAAGLDDRFALLGRGPRVAEPRHQTLRALVDWSWDLLAESERRALTVAAIYPAGLRAADATRIAAAHGISRDDLDALVEKSLLYRAEDRYRALETIREYGAERLGDARDAERLVQLRVLGELAAEQDALLRRTEILDAIRWFDDEDDNVVAALRFGVERAPQDSAAGDAFIELAAAHAWYWVIRDRNDDAIAWLSAAAPLADERDSDAALLVQALALMTNAFGVFDQVEGAERLAAVSGRIEDVTRRARGRRHDLLQAVPVLIRAFEEAMLREGGRPMSVSVAEDVIAEMDPWPRAAVAVIRAAMAQNRGAIDELGEASERAMALFSALGDRWGMALSKQMRSEWLVLQGRLDEALRIADEATELLRSITSAWDLQQQLGAGVWILLRMGRIDEAYQRAEGVLHEARSAGSARAMVLALITNLLLRVQTDDADGAERLLGELDRTLAEWPEPPVQVLAFVGLGRGGVARLRGDVAGAADALREAAEAAAASNDHPIMAMVALGVGRLALDRGDRDDARRALELAVALRGAPDPRDPVEAQLRAAVDAPSPAPRLESGETGLGREEAAAALAQILRR